MKIKTNKDKIIQENLNLVRKVASKIYYRLPDIGIDFDDLFQIGVIGLIKALENYNEDKGKFSTYAYIRIRGEILDFLRQQNKLPHTEKDCITIEKAEPEDAELPYTKTGLILSLDRTLSEDNSNISLINMLLSNSKTPEEEYTLKEQIEKINYIIENQLEENERKIIHYLYFEEKEPKEVQELLGISLGRISQIKSKALEKIKKIIYDYEENFGGKHEYNRKREHSRK